MQVKLGVTNGNRRAMTQVPDPQVVPKAERRRFSAEYKLSILAEADRCREHGTLGQKGGRKPDPQAAEIKRLQRENERLRTRLERAEHIIDVQKKLAQLLGTSPDETPNNENS
jgi:transposase